MRLYQDIKVQLKADFEVRLEEILECPATIKKYNGQTRIDTVTGEKGMMKYETFMHSIKIPDIIAKYIEDTENNSISVELCEDNLKVFKSEGNIEEIDRSNANVVFNYNTRVTAKYDITVYGRLYMNANQPFEDNFQTRDGITIKELVPVALLERIIYEKVQEQNPNTTVEIFYQFENDVKLVSSDTDDLNNDRLSELEDELRNALYDHGLEE